MTKGMSWFGKHDEQTRMRATGQLSGPPPAEVDLWPMWLLCQMQQKHTWVPRVKDKTHWGWVGEAPQSVSCTSSVLSVKEEQLLPSGQLLQHPVPLGNVGN